MDRRLFLGTAAATLALPSVALGAEVEPTLVVQWPAEVPPCKFYGGGYVSAACTWQGLFFHLFAFDFGGHEGGPLVARNRHADMHADMHGPTVSRTRLRLNGHPALQTNFGELGNELAIWTPQRRYGLVVQKKQGADFSGDTVEKIREFLSPRLEHR